MKYWLKSLILLSCLICGWALANVTQLYRVSLPISDASYSEVAKIFPQAFSQVLIKVSGNQQVMSLPQIQQAVSQINQYVQSYRYDTKINADNAKQLFVTIQFDQRGINKLLTQANQIVWTRSRSTSLVWLRVDDGQQPPYVVSMNSDDAVTQALRKDVAERGVQVVLPSMDLQDQGYINTDTTQSLDQQKLLQAAQRYGVKWVLAGAVKLVSPGQWQVDWLLIGNNQAQKWQSQVGAVDALLSQGVNNLVNTMAAQYAASADNSEPTQVSLEVLGVNDLMQYVALLDYLKQLSPVTHVEVVSMNNAAVILNIKVAGGSQALAAALSHGNKLEAVPSSLTQSVQDAADLYYQWLGKKNASSDSTSS